MDFLKLQYDRIQQQLSGLTPSQKMLSAALVVIMVMTLWWWGKYAATPEYEPMLTQGLTPDEITVIATQLKTSGVDHKVVGNQIMVPPDKMFVALGHVGYADVLPKNMASGFDEMIKQLTPWDGTDRQNAIFNHGKELTLQRIISHFPNVASATVIIDPTRRREISATGNVEPTASVNITMRSGHKGDKRLASSCAHLVAGAQAGMRSSQVKVVIDGVQFPVADEGNQFNTMYAGTLEAQHAVEQYENEKLREHLNYITGVRVSVTVRINNASESSEVLEVNKDKSGIFEQTIKSTMSEETTTGPSAGGEAATVPNIGMSVSNQAIAAAPQTTRTQNEESVQNHIVPGTKKSQIVKPAGEHTVIAASVRVPRSHFVLAAKGGDPRAPEPDATAIAKAVAELLPGIKAAVAANTGIQDPEAITVEPFTDFIPPQPELAIASSTNFSGLLTGHVKEIALGGLALASLFMMSMIVRKGAAAPVPVVAHEVPTGPMVLAGSEDIAGEAIGHDPALDGMELDDDSIKTQQMLSQVTSLVGDSPETAAQLIKRWMNQR